MELNSIVNSDEFLYLRRRMLQLQGFNSVKYIQMEIKKIKKKVLFFNTTEEIQVMHLYVNESEYLMEIMLKNIKLEDHINDRLYEIHFINDN